jgi:hypothetical protein
MRPEDQSTSCRGNFVAEGIHLLQISAADPEQIIIAVQRLDSSSDKLLVDFFSNPAACPYSRPNGSRADCLDDFIKNLVQFPLLQPAVRLDPISLLQPRPRLDPSRLT